MSIYRRQFRPYRRIVFIAFGVLLLLFSAGTIWVATQVPSVSELESPETNLASQILASDGTVLGSFYRGENRQYIKLNQIPRNLQDALLVSEDVRFYEHSGIDLFGVLNMFWSAATYVFTRDIRGGSTITQQLARNLYDEQVGRKRTALRKVKEAAASIYLERRFTKREIIVHYLNTVPFGGTIYGVQAAAQYYFDKNCSELQAHESALLVGMLQGTTINNPFRHPERSRRTRNTVINQLIKYHKVSPQEGEKLKALALGVRDGVKQQAHNMGMATYFREYVRGWVKQQIEEKNIRIVKNGKKVTPNIYTDGLKIYTTIDPRMQAHAEAAVKLHLKEHQQKLFQNLKRREPWKRDTTILYRAMRRSARYNVMRSGGASHAEARASFHRKVPMRLFTWEAPGYIDTVITPWDSLEYYAPFLQVGMVSVNPANGHIKTWVGGIDNQFFQYDHVGHGKRQVGSTFKPFVYAAAFDNGFSPCKEESNEQVTIVTDLGEEWTPKNFDNKYGGSMTLKKALMLSINVITARLINQVGAHEVIKYAHNMGIQTPLEPYPSISLGTFDLSVLELTSAYATMAGRGKWHEPIFVTHIEDKDGNLLYRFVGDTREALSEETSYLMADGLRAVVTGGTAANLHHQYQVPFDIFVAGKTGTTQDYSDGWFAGFTPLLATGVWVGCSDRSVHFNWSIEGQGGRMAMPVFAHFTRLIYADSTLKLDRGARIAPPPRMKVETDCERYRQNRPSTTRVFAKDPKTGDLFYGDD